MHGQVFSPFEEALHSDSSDHKEQAGVAKSTTKKRRSPLQPERAAPEFALLGLLLDGPSHGYDLTRQFVAQSELGQVCRLEMSMLYALLKKLEKESLITGRDEPTVGSKSRRMFELTEAGRAEFESWLAQPVLHTREIRLDFLVKLYFARQRNLPLALRLLDEQIEFNQRLLTQLLHHQKELVAANAIIANHFERWVLDFRVEQNTAVLNWLNHCRAELNKG